MIRTLKWLAMLAAQIYLAFLYAKASFVDLVALTGVDMSWLSAEWQQFVNPNLLISAVALVVLSFLFDLIFHQKKRIFQYLWQLIMLVLIGCLAFFICLRIL